MGPTFFSLGVESIIQGFRVLVLAKTCVLSSLARCTRQAVLLLAQRLQGERLKMAGEGELQASTLAFITFTQQPSYYPPPR